MVGVCSVDCERLEFRDLCDWAEANMMPKMLVAKRAVLLGSLGQTAESTEGVSVKFPVDSAQETMEWLAGFVEGWPADMPEPEPVDTDAPFFGWSVPPEGVSEPQQVPAQDLALATVTLLHEAFSSLDFQPETKEALLDLLGVLCAVGPGGSECRSSACSMRESLDAYWDMYIKEKEVTTNSEGEAIDPFTSHYLDWVRIETEHRWCGVPWPDYAQQGWSWCRGQNPGTRGYTCGLWLLFHSLLATAAQLPGTDTVASRRLSEMQKQPLDVVRTTVQHFFGCQECSDNFLAVEISEADLASGVAQELWLWRAHNEATDRIAREERQHSASAPPREQWPTRSACPGCYSASGNWDMDEVARFLLQFYGESGQGSPLAGVVAEYEEQAPAVQQSVSVQVFYFTLCPHCQDFLRAGLLPLVEAGLPGVQLSALPMYPPMLPMASAPPDGCLADAACSLALAPLCALSAELAQPAPASDPRLASGVRFAACDMDTTATGAQRSDAVAEECARQANLTWSGANGVQACAQGTRAFELLSAAGSVLEEAMYHVHDDIGMQAPPSMPWVLVDGDLYYWEGGVCLEKTRPGGERTRIEPPASLLRIVCDKLSSTEPACGAAADQPAATAQAKTRSAENCENCAEVGVFRWGDSWAQPQSSQRLRTPLSLSIALACATLLGGTAWRWLRARPVPEASGDTLFAAE